MKVGFMYQVKTFVRSNAVLKNVETFSSYAEADEHFIAVGFGEGYWAELHQVYTGYTVTLDTTV